MKRAFSYIRFSSKEQQQGDSERRQVAKSRKWADDQGYYLDDSLGLRDLGVSAFGGKNRRVGKLAAFLDAIETGRVKRGDVLLVESLDRLSRDEIGEALELFLGILRNGVEIVTFTPPEHFRPRDKNDLVKLIVALVILSRAHEESATKSERLSDVWAEKRKGLDAKKLTSVSPAWLTLNSDGTDWKIVPTHLKTLRRIFNLCLDGYGTGQIAKKLNEDNVPTFGRAEHWSQGTIRYLLKVRSVLGEFQPRSGLKNAGDPIPDYFPQVIDHKTYYRAQQALESRKLNRGAQGRDRVANLFTGLIRSADDGTTMFVSAPGETRIDQLMSSGAKSGKSGYKAFPYDAFEAAVLRTLKELSPADLLPKDHAARNLGDQLSEAEGTLLDLDHRIAALAAELDHGEVKAVVAKLRDMESTRDELAAHVERLKVEMNASLQTDLTHSTALIDILAETQGEDIFDLRLRLKGLIANLIAEIWVRIIPDHLQREALVQIHFRQGGVRTLGIDYWARTKGRQRGHRLIRQENLLDQEDIRCQTSSPRGSNGSPRTQRNA